MEVPDGFDQPWMGGHWPGGPVRGRLPRLEGSDGVSLQRAHLGFREEDGGGDVLKVATPECSRVKFRRSGRVLHSAPLHNKKPPRIFGVGLF